MIPDGVLTVSCVLCLDHRPSPGDQLDEKHNQCNDQQDVNEPTQRIAAHNAQQPQNQEDYKDCPKHRPYLPRSLSQTSNNLTLDAALHV
jgi:hypothetical protein